MKNDRHYVRTSATSRITVLNDLMVRMIRDREAFLESKMLKYDLLNDVAVPEKQRLRAVIETCLYPAIAEIECSDNFVCDDILGIIWYYYEDMWPAHVRGDADIVTPLQLYGWFAF